ncbi:hypothetical protein JHK87_055898 [Glycine soja]|nr:hypothetical protein JHK87_055898 [Glycine soja]
MTVWKDYAIQLHDAINKNHMLKEPLIVMLSLGKIKDVTGQCSDCYCLTVGTVDEVFIDAPWSYDSCPYCTTTLDPSKIGSSCCSCQNQVNHTVPRQWASTYPLYVSFDYNGDKHFIKVRKGSNKFYFADGLKDFRRALGIQEGLVVHFAALDRNTTFHLHFMPPLDRQTSGRPYSTTRTYVFTVDITNRMISTPSPLVLPPYAIDVIGRTSQYLTVEPPRGRQIWRMSAHDGLQTLTTPWYQFLTDNNLMAIDEVVFYYQPNQGVWEIILRKEITWDEDESP